MILMQMCVCSRFFPEINVDARLSRDPDNHDSCDFKPNILSELKEIRHAGF